MGFLLDTNVVSELQKPMPHPNVLAWQRRQSERDAYLSAMVIGEVRQGIERLRPRSPQRAEELDGWLASLVAAYVDRILPVTLEIAQQWGRINVPPKQPPIVDGLMAATALVHRLTLVTRNVGHVAHTGVAVVNPFES